MFDYKKFEKDTIKVFKEKVEELVSENKDIYMVSFDCSSDMESVGLIANTWAYLNEQAEEGMEEEGEEDYYYYKYCEDEWDKFDTFLEVSSDMEKYIESKEGFTDETTCEYTDEFQLHRDNIIDSCVNVVLEAKKAYPDLLMTVNVSEFLDGEERIEIFQKINGKDTAKEYAEHIEDFC